jgi:hypothetical protein
MAAPSELPLALGALPVASDVESTEQAAVAVPKPRWFTPFRLLIIFCIANVMVYLDRGEDAG